MNLRPQKEMHDCFAAAAAVLDAALEIARPRWLERGISILERSNRSGFDWTGYGYPTWSFIFEKRSESAGPVCSVAVHVNYDEPLEEGQTARYGAKVIADVFHLGVLTSLFRWTRSFPLTLEELAGEGLWRVVNDAIGDAVARLPPEYRSEIGT